MVSSKKVLIIIESYPPILNSAGRLFSELAESLSINGMDVVVLTEKPTRYLAEIETHTQHSDRQDSMKQRVIRLPSFPALRSVHIFRYLEQLIKMMMYLVVGVFYGYKRDVIVYSPPLPLALTGILIARLWRTRSIVNVQDIYPETAIALGFMKHPFLIRVGRMLEGWVYRYADHITVHSEGNKEYVVRNGAEEQKVSVVYNWIDLNKYTPGPLYNGFREKYQLQEKFIVSYAGVIGLAQGVDSLLATAREYREDDRICFVIAGGGLGYEDVKKKAEKEGLDNIKFLPHLVEKEYIKLLRSSDVCLVTLLKKLTTPAVPGKLQSIMAVGRPVICSVPAVSDAKAIVEKAHCGLWIDPSEDCSLHRAIQGMLNKNGELERIGRRGREYAIVHFDREKCVQEYFDLLNMHNH